MAHVGLYSIHLRLPWAELARTASLGFGSTLCVYLGFGFRVNVYWDYILGFYWSDIGIILGFYLDYCGIIFELY